MKLPEQKVNSPKRVRRKNPFFRKKNRMVKEQLKRIVL